MTARELRRKAGSRKTRKAARKVLKGQRPTFKISADKAAKARRQQTQVKR